MKIHPINKNMLVLPLEKKVDSSQLPGFAMPDSEERPQYVLCEILDDGGNLVDSKFCIIHTSTLIEVDLSEKLFFTSYNQVLALVDEDD